MKLFRRDEDFLTFERVMAEAMEKHPIRILSYCMMSNHWHFVVWPKKDGEVTAFFRWLAHTHAMRWRVAHHSVGDGHLYQGRFKSFPIQKDEHFLTVCRYVERNALTAGAVKRAELWRWGSLWTRMRGSKEQRALLSDWPLERPRNWVQQVNAEWTDEELERIHQSRDRGCPYGEDHWTLKTASRLGLAHTLRREGRPIKADR